MTGPVSLLQRRVSRAVHPAPPSKAETDQLVTDVRRTPPEWRDVAAEVAARDLERFDQTLAAYREALGRRFLVERHIESGRLTVMAAAEMVDADRRTTEAHDRYRRAVTELRQGRQTVLAMRTWAPPRPQLRVVGGGR